MTLQIIPIRKSINTSYLIRDRGAILVDAGWKGCRASIEELLKEYGIGPEEIRLIVPTHGDFDHTGGAGELREMSGAHLALHREDCPIVENGLFHWPAGVTSWGKISRAILIPFLKNALNPTPEKVDLVLGDDGMSLKEYGIDGDIIYTPGHTFGSVSVILESGEAFVGCLAHNRFPLVFRPGLPIYALDIDLLKQSWKSVLEKGVHTIYPAHGKPFPVEKILPYLS